MQDVARFRVGHHGHVPVPAIATAREPSHQSFNIRCSPPTKTGEEPETKSIYLGFISNWVKRSNVSNIVWCLENSIDPVLHEEVFPGIRTPVDVREEAREPPDWSRADIRFTWKKNLK